MPRLLTALVLISQMTIVVPASAQWTYRSFKMGIDEEIAKTATTQSLNSLSLDFPYRGENHGQLILRSRPTKGFDLMISIDKGQILCGISNCYMRVKFDDNPSYETEFSQSQSRNSTIVFAENPEALEKKIRKAKRMKIELPLYRSPAQVLEFDVTGLDHAKIDHMLSDESNEFTAPASEPNIPAKPAQRAPLASRGNREKGTVTVRFLVKRDGSVSIAQVKHSSGFPRLDEAAVEAVKNIRFPTATVDDTPVEGWYQQEFVFKVKD